MSYAGETQAKVKQSLNRPLGVPEVIDPQISRHSTNEGGEIISGRLHPQEIFPVLISVRG